FLGERFAARIDHSCADRGILGPAGNQPPAHPHELEVPGVTDADATDTARRGGVVVRIDVRRMRKPEHERDRRRIAVQLVAAAHLQPAACEPLAESRGEVTGSRADASTRRAVFATCSVSQYA